MTLVAARFFDNNLAASHNKTILEGKTGKKACDMSNLDLTGGRTGGRLYPRYPLPSVGVVVFDGQKLLLIKRAKEPDIGTWGIPGGAIEVGETVAEAARREMLEECSITVDIQRVLDVIDKIVTDSSGRVMYHYVIIELMARKTGGELKAQSDAAEAAWFKPEEIVGLNLSISIRAFLEKQGIIKKTG
jgi:8-oxo-dGTP diphosphatase